MTRHPIKYMSIFILIGIFCFASIAAEARISRLTDEQLSDIHGQTGLSIWIKDVSTWTHIDSFTYTDTDTGNALELKNISVHGGTIDPITLETLSGYQPAYFDGDDNEIEINYFTVDDPALTTYGLSFLSIERDNWTQYLHYTVGNVVFCDHDIGVLHIGNISNPASYLYLTAHGGPSWEQGEQIGIDEIRYTYSGSYASTSGTDGYVFLPDAEKYLFTGSTYSLTSEIESLVFEGIHLAETASGTSDDPADPSTWSFSGYFRIGDIFNATASNPAMMDIITRNDTGKTEMVLELPMSGTVRVEKVDFGGTDFGPCAIDGIDMHRLQVEIIP